MPVCNCLQLDIWLNLIASKSIDILNKNTPGVKKGEAKSEAPKVILFIYIKIDIMQVEAKACEIGWCKNPNNLN